MAFGINGRLSLYVTCWKTHPAEECALSVVTHAPRLFVSSSVPHNTPFVGPDFFFSPRGRQIYARAFVVGVCVCPAEAQVLIGPWEKRLPSWFEPVSLSSLCAVFTTAGDFLKQTHAFHWWVMTSLSFLASAGQSVFNFATDMISDFTRC